MPVDQIVRELGECYRRGDLDAARALFWPDFRIQQPASLPHGGWHVGHEGMAEMAATFGQHWDVPNLFVLGASTFPNSGSSNPTPTILALTYRTADAIVDKYLKKPGMLS